MSHFKIIYKWESVVLNKTVYAETLIEACNKFSTVYPHYRILDAFPVVPEGDENEKIKPVPVTPVA